MIELKELGGEQAFLKCGMFGWQASGKTRTSSEIAIGLSKYIKSQKPVFFFDTETGSDFVAPLFKKNRIKLVGKKSKAFVDLIESIKIAEANCDVMIIDSVTHVWNELCDSYRIKKYQCQKCNGTGKQGDRDCPRCSGTGVISDRLSLWDYAPIKKEWQSFVETMLNCKLHVIVCGRAGNEYDSQTNIEGKLEIIKSGTKMKAETEFGYEASLLIEMKKEKNDKGIENIAFVWKDRFDVINGKEFKMPKFEDFLPHIELLNLGGEHLSIEKSSSVEMLKTPKGSSEEYQKQKQIILEEITALLTTRYPSSSVEHKTGKIEALKIIFGTPSWTAIEDMKLDVLQKGNESLSKYLESKKTVSTNGEVKDESIKNEVIKGGKI